MSTQYAYALLATADPTPELFALADSYGLGYSESNPTGAGIPVYQWAGPENALRAFLSREDTWGMDEAMLAEFVKSDEEDEEPEPQRYKRLEVTVGVMVPFEWDAEEQTYRLVRDQVATTVGGLFSDAEEGMWVPDVGEDYGDEWYSAETPEMDSAFTSAWRFVTDLVQA